MSDFPLTGWPSDVIDTLIDSIYTFVGENSISEFYIGRTNDLIATKSRHSCDDILPVYQTDSVVNAMDVENALIKEFIPHDKCSNDAEHSGGGASDEYACFVYVAVWC